MPAPDVAALLAQLERSEPDIAEPARVAVEWLAGGEALETISQLDVCEFLWYTLPIKVPGDQTTIARALGELLRLGGMDRYAALCDSPSTARILRTYAREGEEAGAAAYQAALEATGVLPPDIPELSWSSIMGPEEMGAHVACAAALELAIVSRETVDREELTRRWLTASRTELGGDCWLHRVHGERLNRWVLGRGTARRELAQPFEVRLHAPVPAPAEPSLEPVRWLLGLARGGLRLTERLNLARAVAVDAADRFGWDTTAGRAVRGEADVAPLGALKEIAVEELKALRRSGRRLVLTPTGRALLDDPERLWDAVTPALLTPAPGEHDFEVSIRECALMFLVDNGSLPYAELGDRVARVVNGEGWRTAAGGQVTAVDLAGPLGELRRRLDALGLRESSSWDAPWRLTSPGRSAALAALRAQALRPRQYAGLG
ncbi:hypothetical protein [Microbispora sp. ATCC PTA-5024]|uniref:hypothetical protein n=1 Tax=Microbispora sp. ATCC PTA-5024 TaxID=316330 RepID=UPI0003DD0FF4|nr:hypothetical protein [Microbispora sp. ATCC PTA-5024]ETK30948.1 hypothetical protein MPTA5024_37445 [Microbispora sp. ATCC PTA-5024]